MQTMHNQLSLKKDLTIFTSILVLVLVAIAALYWYDQRTNEVSDFAKDVFGWLVN